MSSFLDALFRNNPAAALKTTTDDVNVGNATFPSNGQVPAYSTSLGRIVWVDPPSGAPSGSAGGDLSGTYPNPHLVGITNLANGAIAALPNKAAPTSADLVMLSDAAAAGAVSQATIAAIQRAYPGSIPFFVPPATAGGIDDEFDGSTLATKWIVQDLVNGAVRTPALTTLSRDVVFTGTTNPPRYSMSRRKSWATFQFPDTQYNCSIHQPIVIAASSRRVFSARIAPESTANASGGSGVNREVYLAAWADNAGAIDAHNGVMVGLAGDNSGNAWISPRMQTYSGFASLVTSGVTVTNVYRPTLQGHQVTYEYVALILDNILTAGSAYGWAWNDAGDRLYLGSVTYTVGSMKWLGFYTAGPNGLQLAAFDFIREDTHLPF